ncbi:hypothetical protein N7481_007120, partial [Penicillium waksmanii]|uniref:uncharacterized protein n=1 Tax=Penicillium waksmanii TaxID=69791 RepID=UPI00254829E7
NVCATDPDQGGCVSIFPADNTVDVDIMDKAFNSPPAMASEQLAPGYQLEMLDASMKQNIIVAMDTGSGKTHIAVLRIKAELETCASHKLIWFLAPTVALCFQQHGVLKTHIPNVQIRMLTGLDNVDRWAEQSAWDKALQDIRIIVSTHAVLADALNHGFVRMSQLALIVFDEAHHCMRRHPANKIMQLHYHPLRESHGTEAVPSILGLTASPIVRSNKEELQAIEANLNAVCKTPRVNRTELLECVHRPHLKRLSYTPTELDDNNPNSRFLLPLRRCIRKYDIQDDPYIELMRQDPDKLAEAHELLVSGKTFCKEQLVKFLERSVHMYEELGGWATDFLIKTSIEQFRHSVENDKDLTGINREERLYLLDLLMSMSVPEGEPESFHISPKLATLFEYLEQMDQPEFSAIIFAQRRAVVGVLARLVSLHPITKGRFESAPYVGWSSYQNGDCLGDLVSKDMQRDTLSEFRTGRKNLIVTTDVLEEGLDISSCSLVICFDKPANLKSFVQRRGRARRQASTYTIMASTEDDKINVAKWQELEKVMVETYLDDRRRQTEMESLERYDETVERRLFVPSTSACLSADESMQHLHHFCSVLPHSNDNDNENRPIFIFEEDNTGMIQATVILPSSVHPAVRRAQGENWWHTEHAATKEASFLAYEALWKYGLVNDNLLPATQKTQLEMSNAMNAPTQSSSVWISGQYDPYVPLARAWTSSGRYCQTKITFSIDGVVDENLTTSIVLPMLVAMPAPITLYWSLERQLLVQFSLPKLLTSMTPEHISTMQQITAMLLKAPSARGANLKKEDYVVPFVPCIAPEQFADWLHDYEGTDLVLESFERDPDAAPLGFIRDTSIYAEARIFMRWVVDATKKNVSIECQSLPQRRNLLNPATMYQESKMGGPPALAPKIQIIPATGCTVSKIPAQTGIMGRFFSAILDRLEATLVAQELASTILKGVGFNDISHVLTAITMPIAQARTDYQLYEFFGDSVLKYTVACQLFYANPTWQEARLSMERDKVISNSNLTRSALLVGLDAYILADRFTPTNWSAPSIEDKLSRETPKRQLANKVIADVVEALIGAAYMDGGMAKAQTCLYRFMPEADILQDGLPSHANGPSKERRSTSADPPHLLWAFYSATPLTHASGSHDGSQSYNRLEYLGDAVLDIIVVSTLASLPKKITQGQMTLLKHALTNGNLLAFLCMSLYIEEELEPSSGSGLGSPSNYPHHSNPKPKRIHLYDFLRYNGDITAKSRTASITRYNTYREETTTALQTSPQYPWLLLAQMHADKFFCDIIESTIGAIFVDSRGDMEACTSFVERVGVLPILRRFIQDEVDVQHPRNKAQGILKEERMVEFKITGALNNYTCTARYGPKQGPLEDMTVVRGVAFREEAEVRAAYAAIPLLVDGEIMNAEKDRQTQLERVVHRQEQNKLKKKRKREAKLQAEQEKIMNDGKGEKGDPMDMQ